MSWILLVTRGETSYHGPKPRATWTSEGIGYWVVRTVMKGRCIQGAAATLVAAYWNFQRELESCQLEP
jgi:hypothetical protein